MATNPQTTWQQAHEAAQALHNQLKAARTTNAADSETVSDAMFAVDTILTALNQEDMASRTGQMQAAGSDTHVRGEGSLRPQRSARRHCKSHCLAGRYRRQSGSSGQQL